MKKIGIVALAAAGLVGATAQPADAFTGPCEKQREAFEKYNIEFNMDAPLAAYVYNEACAVTG